MDITTAKAQSARDAKLMQAMYRSQAVIEFNMDGEILDANENFLKVMGYRLDEVVGRKHAMFADPAFAASAEYKQFWDRLRGR